MLNSRPSILFLSTGDATGSRMAGAFFRNLTREKYDVVSTAVKSDALHPLTNVAMREAGIDIASEVSASIAETLKQGFTCVVTICDAARERHPIFPFTPRLVHWSITDPANSEGSAEQIELMRQVRDNIADQVSRFISETGQTTRRPASQLGWERAVA